MGLVLLSQAAGYGIFVGLAILFCIIILVAVRLQKRYLTEDSDQSEMFMVANRSVGTGLTCSAVFSSWMWINESVFSSVYTYKYGVALPLWWASGLSFQIALMALLGIVAKLRVPHAHTSLEFIRRRYGNYGHILFIFMNLINNIFGCGTMILSGAQLVTGVTGMNVVAASILIPVGVVLYTAVGGLKATFLTDFLHTTIALILLIYFIIAVLTNEHIGGPAGLYEKVLAANDYIDGNYKGSLLSFKSRGAIIFGLVLKFGNLALVLMDTAFWQKSFASEVSSTVPGYDLASIAIIAVPWATGTVIGLTCRAIEHTPIFVTYPNVMTADEVNSGMVMPYVLMSLLGKGATTGLLVLTFMAITSTVSSSMIAVSSIISFDFYRTYLNSHATDRQTLKVSHWGVVFHGALMAGFSIMLNYIGADANWVNYVRPIISCPGILPLLLTLLWSGQTKAAAIASPLLGLLCGIATWTALAWYWYGAVTIETTEEQLPALYGAIVSFFSPAVFSVAISYARPQRFDWREFLKIDLIEDKSSTSSNVSSQSPSLKGYETDITKGEKSTEVQPVDIETTTAPQSETRPRRSEHETDIDLDNVVHPFSIETLTHIKKWRKYAACYFVANVLVTIVAWPLPLYRDWIFSKSFFSGWVTVAIIWLFCSFGIVVVFPIYDGRNAIMKTIRGLRHDSSKLRGKSA